MNRPETTTHTETESPAGQTPRHNRREMFRSIARYLALGGIALGSGALIAREAASSVRGDCRRAASCDGCAAVSRCQLPQARAARRDPSR